MSVTATGKVRSCEEWCWVGLGWLVGWVGGSVEARWRREWGGWRGWRLEMQPVRLVGKAEVSLLLSCGNSVSPVCMYVGIIAVTQLGFFCSAWIRVSGHVLASHTVGVLSHFYPSLYTYPTYPNHAHSNFRIPSTSYTARTSHPRYSTHPRHTYSFPSSYSIAPCTHHPKRSIGPSLLPNHSRSMYT